MNRTDWTIILVFAFAASFIVGAASTATTMWKEPLNWSAPYDSHEQYFPTDKVTSDEGTSSEWTSSEGTDECPYSLCLRHGKHLSWMKTTEAWTEK